MGLDQNGYFMVQAEFFGFTQEVYVIGLPKGKFMDFKKTNDPEKYTNIFSADFSRKFYFPAD